MPASGAASTVGTAPPDPALTRQAQVQRLIAELDNDFEPVLDMWKEDPSIRPVRSAMRKALSTFAANGAKVRLQRFPEFSEPLPERQFSFFLPFRAFSEFPGSVAAAA
jgi:hypothetical protein